MKSKMSAFEIDELRRHVNLSPKEKLEYLEQLNDFLSKAMSEESKEIWKKLKDMGW